MSFLDKVRGKSQVGRGHVKKRFGRATGNPRLQADGLADQVVGAARQLVGRVVTWLKDAGRDLRRGVQH